MRRKCARKKMRPFDRFRFWAVLAVTAITFGCCAFSNYVDEEIKPTVQALAEYECRSITTQVMNDAILAQIQSAPAQYEQLYLVQTDENGRVVSVQANSAAMNMARLTLVAAVEDAMQALPQKEIVIPFGSLTSHSLLGGVGPGWRISLLPQGYVEGEILEQVEAVSINDTRYEAVLELRVTVNMILDGRTSTLQVVDQFPLASLLAGGEIPQYYRPDR